MIFAVLEIWSCSVVSMADWVTDHKTNRAPDQRHIGTFFLAWAEASTLGAWSRPCCVVFSWGPTSGHFRPRARVPGCPVPRPKVLQALQGMRWELQQMCTLKKRFVAGFPSIDGWMDRLEVRLVMHDSCLSPRVACHQKGYRH